MTILTVLAAVLFTVGGLTTIYSAGFVLLVPAHDVVWHSGLAAYWWVPFIPLAIGLLTVGVAVITIRTARRIVIPPELRTPDRPGSDADRNGTDPPVLG